MQRWLFETPWWLLAVIAVAAVALLVSGNNRQDKQLKLLGIALLVLDLALWGVSYFVETPREISVRQTREAVAAVVAKDTGGLDRLLHPKAVLLGWGREEIISHAAEYADRFGLQSAYITGTEAQPADSIVTVRIAVLSRHDARIMTSDTVPSTWELKWMQSSGDWKLKEITPIRIYQTELSQLPSGLFGR